MAPVEIHRFRRPNEVPRSHRPYLVKPIEEVRHRTWLKRYKELMKVARERRTSGLQWKRIAIAAAAAYQMSRDALGEPVVIIDLPRFEPVEEPIRSVRDAVRHVGSIETFVSMYRIGSPEDVQLIAFRLALCTTRNLDDMGFVLKDRNPVPEKSHRHKFGSIMAFLLYLFRLSGTVTDEGMLGAPFGLEKTRVSRCLNMIGDWIYKRHAECLTSYSNLGRVKPQTYQMYKHAMELKYQSIMMQKGYADDAATLAEGYEGIAFLVDGTFLDANRLGEHGDLAHLDAQRWLYDANHGGHGIGFIGVQSPSGIILAVDGPWPGRNNDLGMLSLGGFHAAMANAFDAWEDQGLVPRFLGDGLFQPVERMTRVPTELDLLNKLATHDQGTTLATLRSGVEHAFLTILAKFAYFRLHTKLSLVSGFPGRDYRNAALLVNCVTCVRGSQVTSFYGVVPPSLELYLDYTKQI